MSSGGNAGGSPSGAGGATSTGGAAGSSSSSPSGWQGVLDPKRAVDWTTMGAGPIPTRTTTCATLQPGATAAQINAAIAACPAGQVVSLAAGRFDLGAPGLVFADKSDVTLRGAGADKTVLAFTAANSCGGLRADICVMNGDANYTEQPSNVADWTAGYAKGSTEVTLTKTANLRAGSLLILDQINDSNTDTGTIWNVGHGAVDVACSECQTGTGRTNPDRQQQQIIEVKAVAGNTITLGDPLSMPNWRMSQSPGAWWSSDNPVSGVGIEDLQLDHSGSKDGWPGVGFYNAARCWVRGIQSKTSNRSHVLFYQSAHITVRDSYFWNTQAAESESYGVEHFQGSANLVENNIFHHIASPMLSDGGTGTVFAYNFSFDDFYDVADWAQGSWYHHGPGNSYFLWEGNDGFGLMAETVHGTANLVTAFRNRAYGVDPGKTQQTVPIHIYAFSRYFNIVGNVLGTSGYHTKYESNPSSPKDCDTSIYAFDFGGNCGGSSVPNDAKDSRPSRSTMRWGNYDTVNAASRFLATEVPAGDPAGYPNPVPATQTLPPSFYLTSKPGWFGATPWPPAGPEVSGGDVPGVGGHAHKIPARRCFEAGAHDGNNVRTDFNAAVCYGAGP